MIGVGLAKVGVDSAVPPELEHLFLVQGHKELGEDEEPEEPGKIRHERQDALFAHAPPSLS